MTKQILFVQGGGGEGVHDQWDNKLVASLQRELGPAYDIRYPLMPNEGDPQYDRWSKALAKEFDRLDDGAILVGHSIGATIMIETLAQRPPKSALAGVFMIAAPFIGEDGWPSEEIGSMSTLGARLPSRTPIYLYHGADDETAPIAHLDLYAKAIPQAVVRRLDKRDHQLNDDLSELAADIQLMDRRA